MTIIETMLRGRNPKASLGLFVAVLFAVVGVWATARGGDKAYGVDPVVATLLTVGAFAIAGLLMYGFLRLLERLMDRGDRPVGGATSARPAAAAASKRSPARR